jgi:hypothetical protein
MYGLTFALVLAIIGGLCVAVAVSIRGTARVTGENKSYDHAAIFIVGILLLAAALVLAVVSYVATQSAALH